MIPNYYKRSKGIKYQFKSIINYSKDKQDIKVKIAKTPFEVYDSYTNEPTIDYTNYSPNNAIINLKKIFTICNTISPKALTMLMFVCYIIEPDTNVVRLSYHAFHDYFTNSRTTELFFKLIRELINVGALSRMSYNGCFILNHNIFYKGDLNKFANTYRTFYGKWEKPDENLYPTQYSRLKYTAYQLQIAQNNNALQHNKIKNLGYTKFSFINPYNK